ncbi:hypothetical protein ABK040_008155 [Willaertia magna]
MSEQTPQTETASFSTVESVIQTYYNFNTCWKQKDGREEIKKYLQSRFNAELLSCLERVEECLSIPWLDPVTPSLDISANNSTKHNSNNSTLSPTSSVGDMDTISDHCDLTSISEDLSSSSLTLSSTSSNLTDYIQFSNSGTVGLNSSLIDSTLLKDIFMKSINLYKDFLSEHSQQSVNINSKLRNSFKEMNYKVIELLNKLTKTKEIVEKTQYFEVCDLMFTNFKQLYTEIMCQFKTEIFPNFKNTENFRTFILTKVIDISQRGETDIETFLKNNELQEYCKLFKKKKLLKLSQIQNFSSDDYRNLGIKKLGHIKRLVRIVNSHFLQN